MGDLIPPERAGPTRVTTVEVEGKWRLANHAEMARVRSRLMELGAQWVRAERERNELYDLPDSALFKSDRLLRLRVIDGDTGGLLTVKGPATGDDAIKTREELEVRVNDPPTARAMLALLGYQEVLVYPKTRETWRFAGLIVALDELPFGSYCEIEGAAPDIASAAQSLGLTAPEPRGYPSLMRRWLRDTSSD
jgi:adenylate cyclase, class 2